MNSHEIIPAKTDVGALANRINLETRELHNSVDKLVTLKFAIAIRDAKIYRQGIQMFYHVFCAIEDALEEQLNSDNRYNDMFKAIYKPVMLRRGKLYDDLLFFYNYEDQKFSEPILTEQIKFTNHIRSTIRERPYLLLAYMHVLYLALFAGGRIMSSQITRSLSLFPQVNGKSSQEVIKNGTNFYQFDGYDNSNIENLRIIYKRDYELATRNFLSESEKEEIIDESKYIFSEVGICIKEIETHNLHRIKENLLYQFATKGYYLVMALAIVLVVYLFYKYAFHSIF